MRSHRRLVTSIAALSILVGGCSSSAGSEEEPAADASTSPAALFDASVVHDIEVSFDSDDYDAMIESYTATGEKEWIEASVVIDGATYERVGLRLKGNSSLAGLGGGAFGRPANGGPGPGGASADEPEDLPWLIRLDEYVDGQDHQGYEDVVIRSNGSETSLNEAVALDLLEEAGLASQDAVATSFQVNGGDETLRLAIENPDDDAWYEAAFDGEGALYKGESSGDWSYRGDDPAAYEDVFDQEGGKDVADLTPLMDLLKFLNEADDATFAAELTDRLDVESFATYLAMMDLLDNFDDIDGPGNNAYLWYDPTTEMFTVVPWDMNLAFGASGEAGMPGGAAGRFGPGAEPELPEGAESPAVEGAARGGVAGRGPDGPTGGAFGRTNILVERFHEVTEFEALYQEALAELGASLYGSGIAQGILDTWVDTLVRDGGDLVDSSTVEAEAAAIADRFTTS
jgi:spore coat protein CotH